MLWGRALKILWGLEIMPGGFNTGLQMKREEVNKTAESPSPGVDMQARDGISIVRIQMVREGSFPYGPNPVRNSSDAAKIFQSYLAGADREYFVVLLDAQVLGQYPPRLPAGQGVPGIKVLDHIIVGEGKYVSLADRGFISPEREGG
jgi:hypothetical protein